jgi:hypothetical protein
VVVGEFTGAGVVETTGAGEVGPKQRKKVWSAIV